MKKVFAEPAFGKKKKKKSTGERERELLDIADNAKCKAKGAYDCAVGVSGGKDSTFQAFYAKEKLGLRTLLVNFEPDNITPVGKQNIENLKRQGFDVITIIPNRRILKKLTIKEFWKRLNLSKASEYCSYGSTYIIADAFNIPLIIQGENGALTLGASEGLQDKGGSCLNITHSNTLKEDPFKEYIDEEVEAKDLFLYKVPVDELIQKDIQGIWLNYYAKEWSQYYNAVFSIKKGLIPHDKDISPYLLGNYHRYFSLDSYYVPVNQVFKYMKFGFGRTNDIVCYDIRDKLITRDEGKYLIRELDGKCGQLYIDKTCELLGIDEKTMFEHAEKFRGDMFYKNEQGNWRLKNPIWEQEPIEGDYNLQEIMKRLKI